MLLPPLTLCIPCFGLGFGPDGGGGGGVGGGDGVVCQGMSSKSISSAFSLYLGAGTYLPSTYVPVGIVEAGVQGVESSVTGSSIMFRRGGGVEAAGAAAGSGAGAPGKIFP